MHARLSTQDQSLDLQISALKSAGCERAFQDKGISGTQRYRPQLQRAMAALTPAGVSDRTSYRVEGSRPGLRS